MGAWKPHLGQTCKLRSHSNWGLSSPQAEHLVRREEVIFPSRMAR